MRFMRSLVLLLATAVFASACGAVGMIAGGEMQTYQGGDSFSLARPLPDPLGSIQDVGKSLGYSVSGVDRPRSTVDLSLGTSMATVGLIGKSSTTTLTVTVAPNGTEITTSIMCVGNFGAGGQEAAEGRLKEFRNALIERAR